MLITCSRLPAATCIDVAAESPAGGEESCKCITPVRGASSSDDSIRSHHGNFKPLSEEEGGAVGGWEGGGWGQGGVMGDDRGGGYVS